MNISLIPKVPDRVLSTPLWPAKYPPLSFVIGAVTEEYTEEDTAYEETVELTYPGEGFENITLPDCMIGRVKRSKTTRTWDERDYRKIYLVKVNWTLQTLEFFRSQREALPPDVRQYLVFWTRFFNEDGKEVGKPRYTSIDGQGAYEHDQPVTGTLKVLLISRPRELISQGSRLATRVRITYSPAWMVPPLDANGLIPDCGGYFESHGWTTETTDYGHDFRPDLATISATPWLNEAERVRDHFPWFYFQVEMEGVNQFRVRSAPLVQIEALDLVFSREPGKLYNGFFSVDSFFLLRPPSSTPVEEDPWSEEIFEWAEDINWYQVVLGYGAAESGFYSQEVAKAPGGGPAYQVVVAQYHSSKRWTFPNLAISRLVNRVPTQSDGIMEVRRLYRASYHPVTQRYQETTVLTGAMIYSGDTTPFRPAYLVEAYERVVQP
ncbi:MAG: hypothetical protein G8345_07760 [Magnetococcales bacterium]|nr:hypothetical protein [Magnetococcales bacterium]NGZ26771.1 hypothetical protein [Magnetococcales bacterium]